MHLCHLQVSPIVGLLPTAWREALLSKQLYSKVRTSATRTSASDVHPAADAARARRFPLLPTSRIARSCRIEALHSLRCICFSVWRVYAHVVHRPLPVTNAALLSLWCCLRDG